MIRVKILIWNTNGDKFEAREELPDDFVISKNSVDFNALIQSVMDRFKVEEVDRIKVTIYYDDY